LAHCMDEDAGRALQYASYDASSETVERMNRRLAGDLRNRIRKIQLCPPFCPEWNDQVETLAHLSTVAQAEDRESTVRDGTVWERDELCIRIVVEEGKINLLARLLMDYKMAVLQNGVPPDLAPRARVYEQSLGVLVRCCFNAVEAVQTLDVRTFLQYISNVIDYDLRPETIPTVANTGMQEFVVLHYLCYIMKFIGKLNETVVVGEIRDLRIVDKVLRYVERAKELLDRETQVATAFFLASFFDTDDFKTRPDAFIASKEERKRVALLDPIVKDLVSKQADLKKMLRPLMDAILRWK